MKKYIFTLILLVISFGSFAQAPQIEWQKTFGGNGADSGSCVQQTIDGGYIIAGTSASIDGNVTGNHGSSDFWVLKINALGLIQWQVSLGGINNDGAASIQQTSDGGYIVTGHTNSTNTTNGNVTGNHGGYDYWVVKLSSLGSIQWQKTLGGGGNDFASCIIQTNDGGYIVAGFTTSSNSGDVTGNHGSADYWIVKLTNSGIIQWQKAYGGTLDDRANSIIQTSDDGYLIGGISYSNDGDVTLHHSSFNSTYDYWVLKIDSFGLIQWQKSLGSSGNEKLNSVQQTEDGGYILAGSTDSNGFDVSGNHGFEDFWVVKLNSIGTLVWQKTYGGSSYDAAFDIQKTFDGGFIIAGYTLSSNGDVSINYGGGDFWILKINNLGVIQWQKSWGVGKSEEAHSIKQTSDGGFIVVGFNSFGDISGTNGGGSDLLALRFAPEVNPPSAQSQTLCNGGIISNLIATGLNIKWYSTQTGGTALLPSTILLSGTYYASQTVNSIESARTSVAITINSNTSNTTFINACNSYTWSVNNQTYTSNGTYTSTTGCHTEILNLTISCISVVNLKLYIEGYYDATISAMRPVKNNQDGVSPLTDVEDIIVELHHPETYAVIATAIATLHTDGTLQANFTSITSDWYNIVVKGNNIVQTWSATPQTIGTIPLNYDFTTTASKAYGNNMRQVEPGVWALYSGDLDGDGFVDVPDYSIWENDYILSAVGVFSTDLDGDGFVDVPDYSTWENNYINGKTSIYPTN